jgi:hypothetical protein
MDVPRKRLFATFVSLTLLAGSAGSVWRVRAQGPTTARQPPVQTLKGRTAPPPVTSGDRGVTYHSLERQATRVTTRFADAVAIANRAVDGQLVTRLTDLAGNDMVTFRVHHVDGGNDSLEFAFADRPGEPARHAARRSGLRPTLDWSNEQAYSLWKDRGTLDRSSLEWQDTLMRPAGAPRRNAGDGAVQTDTEWRGGFSATVTRKLGTHVSYLTGRRTTGVVFISSFKRDGIEVGSSQWWPQEQTLAWAFPGLTEGYADASRLQQSGGWRLAPDMAWMNTQNLAFYQFHTLVKERGTTSARSQGWLQKIGALIAPILHANEPGCDFLHWLDQTIFRPCCDSHDRCYSKQDPNCGASSWWMWWSSWRCDACNIAVVACFMTFGGSHVYHRYP